MFHVNMFEHSGDNVFETASILRQLYKRGVFSHRGVISTEHGRSDLRSPVRHKTLLSPVGKLKHSQAVSGSESVP